MLAARRGLGKSCVLAAGTASLLPRCVEPDAERYRDIELGDAAHEGNTNAPRATHARRPPQSTSLAAEHPAYRARKVGIEQAFLALGIGPNQPDAALLQVAHGPREVGDSDDGHGLDGTGSHLGHRRVDADRAILRNDHRVDAKRVRAAQTCAQVVRIGHAVEQQQQRRSGHRIEDLFEGLAELLALDLSDDALMDFAVCQLGEARIVDRVNVDAERLRELDDLTGAAVLARRRDVNCLHALRALAEPRRDSMESDQIARSSHERLVTVAMGAAMALTARSLGRGSG